MKEWMTIQDAAEYLQLSVPSIRKYIRLNKLPAYREGHIVRLKKIDLDNFLKPINREDKGFNDG